MIRRNVLNSVIDNLAITKRGILESVTGGVCTVVVDGQVYPDMDFMARLDLKNNIGEEVIICFIDNDRSDGVVVGLVADTDSTVVTKEYLDARLNAITNAMTTAMAKAGMIINVEEPSEEELELMIQEFEDEDKSFTEMR